MKKSIYICILAVYGFMAGITVYAQTTDASSVGKDIGKEYIKPDTAIHDGSARYNMLGDYYDKSLETGGFEIKLLPVTYFELEKAYQKDKVEEISSLVPTSLLNNSMAVGSTIGIADVTSTGAASYQIPMAVPQGIAGFEPTVSINYSSQTSVGLVGYGWHLSAFSVVSRGGKTFYHDHAAEAPQLSNSDNLILDGQRLMLISGQNLTNGAKYRMENDPSTDIAYKAIGSYYGFVVRSKDGMTREFGATANSNIEASGGNTLFWLLSKVTDKNGNTITYQYEEIVNNGEFYLTNIQYAGNRSIQFSYEARNDKQKGYHAGVVVNSNKILKSISTYIGQTRIKQYQLNYVHDGFYSKLTEIVESGQNSQRYNSTLVNYGYQGTEGNENLADLSVKREGNKPLFADFDGDGRAEFCCARYTDNYIIRSFTDNQTLLAQSISNGLGAFTSFQ